MIVSEEQRSSNPYFASRSTANLGGCWLCKSLNRSGAITESFRLYTNLGSRVRNIGLCLAGEDAHLGLLKAARCKPAGICFWI